MSPIDELKRILRPAGGGLYLVSTGRKEQIALQKEIYRAKSEEEIDAAYHHALDQIATSPIGILGIPSDVGAGFLRGSNLSPLDLRVAASHRPSLQTALRPLLDVGDVRVVPQILHDEMCSADQLERTRAALYPDDSPAVRNQLPASPLSIAERAVDLMLQLNPDLRLFSIGGDHACSLPIVTSYAKLVDNLGVVQFDAHTDMLEERLGIKYCFATWSYHASSRLKTPGNLVQFGVRASRFPKEHWESKYGIVQHWATRCLAEPERVIRETIDHYRALGVTKLYISNDIDGTDETFADATGTPEPNGLLPEFVREVYAQLTREFEIVGTDLMEVALAIPRLEGGRARTLETALSYWEVSLQSMAVR